MSLRPRIVATLVAFGALLCVSGPAHGEADGAAAPANLGTRLANVRSEIERLESELQRMQRRERTLLGDLERLATELRLRQAESSEAQLQLDAVGDELQRTDADLAELDASQAIRKRYLSFRLREIYKDGPGRVLYRLVGGERGDRYWRGLQYASYLNQRDQDVLQEFVADADRSLEYRARLDAARIELQQAGTVASDAAARAEQARTERQRALRRVRADRGRQEQALEELRSAAAALEATVEQVAVGEPPATLDVRQFRGLLDWPAEGPVPNGFGTIIHPQFGTRVPHPGLDIAAPYGAAVRAAFDGRVVYADWMRGYGLTAIVDHGSGVLSIYAHASALVVEADDEVATGQMIGSVGDTGSLRGAHLYFELRVDGEPVDPRDWLSDR